jgi:hypothetical protein
MNNEGETMKRSLLTRLRSNGASYLISGLLLLLGIPLYQTLILGPTGFSHALDETGSGRYTAYLAWISTHLSYFLIYRALLLLAFVLLLTFPFSLYQIIVAQEIMGQQERESEEGTQNNIENGEIETEKIETDEEENNPVGMPEYAWRGKGFVVLAAWLGLLGLIIYLIGTATSTGYYLLVASSTGTAIQNSVITYSPILVLVTNTIGSGFIGLSCLFFGAMILRTGRNLWPGIWVAFSYVALFSGAILCISAIAVASAPGSGQSTLTTIATLLFAILILWFGAMLIRLKPEA